MLCALFVNIYKNYPNDPTYQLPALKGAELDPALDWIHLVENEAEALQAHEEELREADLIDD